MSTRPIAGTPPFGAPPPPAFDESEPAPAFPATSAARDGLDDPGAPSLLGRGHGAGMDGLAEAGRDERWLGGLGASPGTLDRIGTQTLALDDSPALFARVAAGFAILDGCSNAAFSG